jgi:hypothetical protein
MSLSRYLLVLGLVLASLPGAALAQRPDTTVEAPSSRTTAPPRKSPVRAGLYSLGATVLPGAVGMALLRVDDRSARVGRVEVASDLNRLGAVLLMGGLVGGPAAGHFYADRPRRARVGLWIRGGATGVGIGAATIILLDTSFDFFALGAPRLSRTGRIAEDVLNGALLVVVGSALFDGVTAPLSARRHNADPTLRVRVVPHLSPTLARTGLSLTVRF